MGNPAEIQAQLEATPGYQFQLQQGNQNVINNASALGLRESGATAKDLTSFAQGLAGTTYQNWLTNLHDLSNFGVGQGTDQLAGTNAGYADALSGLASQQGAITANGIIGKSQAQNQMWGGVAGYADSQVDKAQNMISKLFSGGFA